jgi:hypothetical protein
MSSYTSQIRELARKYGDWHRPAFFLDEIEKRTGHRLSHGSVISAIGTHKSRASTTPTAVKKKVRELYELCGNDLNTVKWIVSQMSE